MEQVVEVDPTSEETFPGIVDLQKELEVIHFRLRYYLRVYPSLIFLLIFDYRNLLALELVFLIRVFFSNM